MGIEFHDQISPAQTQDILDSRLSEELNTSLSISVYDVARNETARQHRQELVSLRCSVCVDGME